MPIFSRHEIDPAHAQYIIESRMGSYDRYLERVTTKPRVLPGLGDMGFITACAQSVLDPTANTAATWDAVVLAVQGYVGVFAIALTDQDEVELRVGRAVYRIPKHGPWSETDPTAWERGMYCSMICRDRSRIDLMASVPQDVLAAAGGAHDAYLDDWIRALQTYWREEPGLVDTLLRAMGNTDPAQLRVADEDWALQIKYPPMELFYLVTQREEAKFNESLARALELHKRYWGANQERRNDPVGFVAWAPLAIACLAKDLGFAIDVESDYLPANLLDGTWVGERTI